MAALFDLESDSSEWSDTASDERPVGPVSARSAVTADTWKGQLDFDRPCSGPERRCWLCTELTPWNRAMHGLAFELVERRPGKLQLRSMPHGEGDIEKNPATAAADVSFLASWLLQHHPCIDELKVGYGDHPGCGNKETPFPIRLRPATGSDSRRIVRGLELESNAMPWSGKQLNCYELEDLDAVGGLESLKLDFNKIKPKFAAELAKLLRRNAGSIKRFQISNAKVPRLVNKALRYLFNCESLAISSYHDWRGRPLSMVSLARLLHSSTALKELTVAPIASRAQMSILAKELENNTTLKKLGVNIAEGVCSPEPVFTALLHNTTLEELRVSECRINRECGHALALLLQENTGLRLLYLGQVLVFGSSLHLLAAALKANTTLESLHLSSEILPGDGISALCKALHTNKTLKKLVFIDVRWRQSFSDALARQLTQDDCYSRVELPWTEPDLPGLTAALTSSLAAIEEFRLPDIRGLSLAGLEQLFDALASSKCVRTLGVRIEGDPGRKGRALCEMLKANRTIDCLDLGIDKDNGKFVGEILHALAENTGITKMLVGIDEVREFETATSLSYLLAHNKTATKFSFSTMTSLYFEFVEEFSRGMQQNKTIVKFWLATNLLCDAASFPFFEAVRRNQGALNRAVDFVVSPSLDRQCAEGFECFSGRPCLRKLLKKVTGKTEPEALLAISAAERYLRDNYLLITGIVRHSVECHPAKTTQVDALNKDCWLAIVRHLTVADVLA
ncbi:uncharacterized protein LOC144145907 [Haemaphysalis longicornis]